MRELPPGFENFNDVMYDIESRFTVKSLKAMCQSLGIAISGTKGALQQRLRTTLNQLVGKQDVVRFNIGKTAAESERGKSYTHLQRSNGYNPSTSTSTSASSHSTSSQTNIWGMSPLYQNIRLPVYKKLPFYNLLTNVTQAYNVSACPTSRITQSIHVRLTTEMINKLLPKSPSNPYRLVLFCTQTDRVPYGNCVIEFPSHAEIRCNGSLVTANLRGIKNKPGTVNPPDITGQAILIAAMNNKVDVTFAETKVSYNLVIYLVEKSVVSQLVEKIQKRGFISKESTLNKMKAVAQDADIVAGPETLTLKDPISMVRIDLPCKSRYCGHTACFDAATFLTLNEQTPTWTCPICNRSISNDDDLFLDGYVYDVLQSTSKAVESVVIHPDGSWTNKDIDTDHPDAKFLSNDRPVIRPEERKLSFGVPRAEVVSLDDEDEEAGVPTPASLPPISRNASASVRPSPSQPSRKRGPSQMIDLTLSDEEDTPPLRNRQLESILNKRPRVDTSLSNQRPTTDSNINSRLNSVLNGTSQTPSSIRESHVRSPPSSISPRNEHNSTMYRFNHSPATLDAQTLSIPPVQDYTFPTNPAPLIPSINTSSLPPLIQSRPQLPSPTMTRSYPNPPFPINDPLAAISNSSNNNNPRSHSASPVLPAFSPPRSRNTSASNSFMRFDWDSLRDMPNGSSNDSRSWDPERDDFDNEDLDLEMARLPSSMFDADGRQDYDDY